MDTSSAPAQWSALQKLLFRFIAVYLVIYIFPFPANMILESPWQKFGSLFDPFVNWVGHHVLHLQQNVNSEPNGSGDTSYFYVQEFIFIGLTVAATIVWAIADRHRNNYAQLLYWLKVAVRYYLAFFLLVYGCVKFVGGQFPAPSLERLMQPYGKSSPMGLAWTFFGFSKAYGFFMGLSECAGGVFLLFRRTTLFGACIATTVVTNIVMVNFCYDVPVKLFSSHLLLMCLFVLCTEGSRFVNLFLLNKPAEPIDLSPVFRSRKMRVARIVAKVLIVLTFIGLPLADNLQTVSSYFSKKKPPLYGVYYVKEYVVNNDTIPPLTSDTARWDKLIVGYPGYALVQTMTEKNLYFEFKPDTVHNTIMMCHYRESKIKYQLNYTIADSTLCIYGRLEKDSVYVRLQRFDEQKYLLLNRGFHWINEFPYNR